MSFYNYWYSTFYSSISSFSFSVIPVIDMGLGFWGAFLGIRRAGSKRYPFLLSPLCGLPNFPSLLGKLSSGDKPIISFAFFKAAFVSLILFSLYYILHLDFVFH